MRPLTFRAQFTINALTVLIVVLLMLSTNTFASSSFTVMGQSAPTTTISYQGRLSNRGGVAISANTPMVFRLYAAPTGGSALWTETRSGSNTVPVTNGIFSVLLGSVSPISVDLLSRDLWLGIAVNGDPEMTPREKIGSVPYAARAGSVVDGSVTTAKLATGAVGTTKLADSSVTSEKLSPTTDGYWTWLSDVQAISGPGWTEIDDMGRYRPLDINLATAGVLDISTAVTIGSNSNRAAYKILLNDVEVGAAYTHASSGETVSQRVLVPVEAGRHVIKLHVGSWDPTTVYVDAGLSFNVVAYGR